MLEDRAGVARSLFPPRWEQQGGPVWAESLGPLSLQAGPAGGWQRGGNAGVPAGLRPWTARRRAGRGRLLCSSRFTLGAGTPSTASAPRIPAWLPGLSLQAQEQDKGRASATSPAGWCPLSQPRCSPSHSLQSPPPPRPSGFSDRPWLIKMVLGIWGFVNSLEWTPSWITHDFG